MQTKWKIKAGSIRFQFFCFLAILLLILLLLLNIYPYVSARDAVYQEKHRAMESQGSTLSSAIACNLALGLDMKEAVRRAKAYISGALSAMLDLGQGRGPMDHAFGLGDQTIRGFI